MSNTLKDQCRLRNIHSTYTTAYDDPNKVVIIVARNKILYLIHTCTL